MPLTSGTSVGPYEIVRALGAGGMGEVYCAHDARLDRDVAIKVLPAELASSVDMLERFRREARAVAAINHPGIVTIYSVEDADGMHFLTMELIEGESLDRLIPASGLDVERILAIADALSSGLSAAHDRGIIHRDLKPANIMVTKDGAVKILDFGLAKVQGPDAGETTAAELPTAMLTHAGVVMGTQPYMSPEQVQARPLDHRTDIFSLGVVLYEMATGQRPFQGPSAADLFASILRDPAPPVSDLRADLPAGLSRVIRRCLEKDPRHRIQTARDVGNELRDRARLAPLEPARPASAEGSDAAESFRVEVLPFRYAGADPAIGALAEGLSEEIVTGLSRFSYLRVLTKGQSGARYVLEGSLREAGGQVRVAARLIDIGTGANLWAETYTRSYSPDTVFEIQDNLAPPIVSTIAQMNGVLAHSMWIALRGRDPETLTPYEAMLRSFGFYECLTPAEYELARATLKRAIVEEPNHSGCLAMLAIVYANGHLLSFGTEEQQADLGVAYGRRAVAAETTNHWAYFALAEAHVSRRDIPAFRSAAERALALNPLDGGTMGGLALWMAYTGDWQRGRELMERAMALNPRHPAYFWYPLVHDAYRQKDYARALALAVRLNLSGQFWTHLVLAMVHGQLGNREAAADALRELLVVYPEFPAHASWEVEKFFFADRAHAEHVLEGLRKAGLAVAPAPGAASTAPDVLPSPGSGEARADEGFWIAVLPFKYTGTNADLTALVEGLTEDIVTGLSRFSYLRVIARSSTSRYANESVDVRTAGKELGARYVMEGNLRQAGGKLRLAVQLVDAVSGAHLWAENYERTFSPETVFELQDDLVPRIVSTVADSSGVLPHSISEMLRRKSIEQLSPYETVLRYFGYLERGTPEEHAKARDALERAVANAPDQASCWATLAMVYRDEHTHGFNVRPDPLGRALAAAHRAVEAGPSNHLAHLALASALFFRREIVAFRSAAERTIALSPMDSSTSAYLGTLMLHEGEWERGCALVERARQLNPNHPGWYWFAAFWDAYRKQDYRAALEVALRINMPGDFYVPAVIAAAYAQLGELDAARPALRQLLAMKPDFAATAREEIEKWFGPGELVEHFLDGLRKAGLDVPALGGSAPIHDSRR